MSIIFSSEREPEDEDGSMFGPREGSWALHSKTDSRWNCSGRAKVGGLECPSEAYEKIKELEKTLGKMPDDLAWSYMKD